MAIDYNDVYIGFDLNRDYAIMTFHHQNNSGPRTVSMVQGEEQYQLPLPKEVFSLGEGDVEKTAEILSGFFKESFERLSAIGPVKGKIVAVTMERMTLAWARIIRMALGMAGIPEERVYLQDHMESIFYYVLNQNKDLWRYKVALFEYENDFINAYELSVQYGTKPAFVYVTKKGRICLDKKTRGNRQPQHWKRMKDARFLEQAKKVIGEESFSSVYLMGEGFDQSWEKESVAYLCKKRHVYRGNNLYSKGACYGTMDGDEMNSMDHYLYRGSDMVEQNIGMKMIIQGREEYYNMITAGINYYMACCECEYLLDNTDEVILYSQSITGEKMIHTISLNGLPVRPKLATRIHMEISFLAQNQCKVKIEDMGLGEFYQSSGKKWEAVIKF